MNMVHVSHFVGTSSLCWRKSCGGRWAGEKTLKCLRVEVEERKWWVVRFCMSIVNRKV